MADQVVQITAGTGTKIDVSELTVGANTVERQRINIADPVNATSLATVKAASTAAVAADPALVVSLSPNSPVGLLASSTAIGARPDGFLYVKMDPTTILNDTFEILDTTNTWTTGGTSVPTVTSGVLTLAPGTTASNTSWMKTQASFSNGSSAYTHYVGGVTFEAGAITGNQRFWGLGTITAPTLTVPIINGAVFELDNVAGALLASVYSVGVRTQSTALTRPVDAGPHRYAIYYRTSRVYYELDSIIVATFAFPNTAVAALGAVIGSVNGGSTLGVAAALTATLMGIGDSARNASQIGDATYPWRKAQVGKAGGLSIKGSVIVPVSGSIAAAGTGTIGPLDVSEAGNATFTVKNTIAASAYAGAPVLVFEQSDDNVSWGPLIVVRSDTLSAGSTVTLAPNSASASLMFDAAMEGVNWVRCRVTTGPATNALTVNIVPGGFAFSPSVAVSGNTGGYSGIVAGATMTRPANTTAYVIGQLVANSVTAGSVVPISLTVARTMAGSGQVRRARLVKSGTVITNASFRVHLYRTSPTVTNGDGAAWLSNNAANYMGSIDLVMLRAFSDGAVGIGLSNDGSEIFFNTPAGVQTVFALLEARAAYTPTSGETFTLTLETLQD